MAYEHPAPFRWVRREEVKKAPVEQSRHSCYAFKGNSVTEVVCGRVSSEPEGNRIYCLAHNCQSPWRVNKSEALMPQPTPLPVVIEQEKSNLVVQKELRGMDRRGRKNLAALEESSLLLRSAKPQLQVYELIRVAAQKLGMSASGLKTFFFRALSEEMRARLLYGEGGKKLTHEEIKFGILMKVRDEIRERDEPAPTKRQLAALAAKPLGLTILSAEGYIYDCLRPEQAEALEFAKPPFTLDQQVAILKRIRQEMRDAGRPKPRQIDLATAVAPLFKIKPTSARALIADLSKELRRELDLAGTRS